MSVKRAAAWAAAEGLTIVSSVGMNTWDLVTATASRIGAQLHVLVPALDPAHFEQLLPRILHEYGLDPARTSCVPVFCNSADRHAAMQQRDCAVVAAADVLVPLCLRPSGAMARLLAAAASGVVNDFEVPYVRRTVPLKYTLDSEATTRQMTKVRRGFLTHWTRSANGPWPTERVRDYCDAVLDTQEYPRSAFATLRSILATGRIAASPRHMPGNTPCVSLTAKQPHEFLAHMRWRARYREMSFEPYGIGIAADAAVALGARPVDYAGAADTPAWLHQTPGTITDWRDEREWRCAGDIDLSEVARDQVVCFCWTACEAAALTGQFGVDAFALEG